MCKLLISIAYPEEYDLLLKYRNFIDIVDLKDVECGESLGCPSLRLVRYVLERRKFEISIPIGDITNYISCIKFLIEYLDSINVNYIKVGLFTRDIESIENIVKNIRNLCNNSKLVIACFGDYHSIDDIINMLDICRRYDIEIFMIDTKFKNYNKSIVDILGIDNLCKIVELCHINNIKIALAGKLNFDSIKTLLNYVRPDIIGLRSCICDKSRNSIISEKLLITLLRTLGRL